MIKIKKMLEKDTILRNNKGQLKRDKYSRYKDVMVVIFRNFIGRINKKHNKKYTVLSDEVINCTNYANNKKMVLYTNGTQLFVRDIEEFEEKFEPTEENK